MFRKRFRERLPAALFRSYEMPFAGRAGTFKDKAVIFWRMI
jgi:hypothetical protein